MSREGFGEFQVNLSRLREAEEVVGIMRERLGMGMGLGMGMELDHASAPPSYVSEE